MKVVTQLVYITRQLQRHPTTCGCSHKLMDYHPQRGVKKRERKKARW
ncbi:hypothetical protein KCP69_16665 [Salmonella enterica subsp. enterica]|nr:hypothetical protein KCP69_16665 [Salmonella enterica subsp. enterica]